MKKMFVIILLDIIAMFVQELRANVVKTSEMLTFAAWRIAILDYQKARGRLPRSWNEMSEEKACEPFLKRLSLDMPDFIKRNRFLSDDIRVEAGEHGRVWAMGTESLNLPNSVQSGTHPIRMVMIQMGNGLNELSIASYPDDKLESLLSYSGMDLRDFTGPGGKWEQEPSLAKITDSSSSPRIPGNGSHETGNLQKDFQSRHPNVETAQEGVSDVSPFIDIIRWALLTALLMFLIFLGRIICRVSRK